MEDSLKVQSNNQASAENDGSTHTSIMSIMSINHSWVNQLRLSRHGTDLLIFTSGAFLLPAHRSGRRGLNWFSAKP